MVNFINFIAVFFAGFFLKKLGRKTIMLIFPFLMVILHMVIAGCLWVPTTDTAANYTSLACIVLFVTFFEFSMGPVLWLYNAEILNEKSNSVAAIMNWVFVLIISYFTPGLLESIHGKLFLIFGSILAFHCVFAFIFMKETKGLTNAEAKTLYITK